MQQAKDTPKRFFNTEGPIIEADHYFLPQRLNEEELFDLIERKRCFTLHAPRQTGKTTAIIRFIEMLKQDDRYLPLYVNVEPGQVARGDPQKGIQAVLNGFASAIRYAFGDDDPALKT